MNPEENYSAVNKASWNKRTEIHFDSKFYDNESFIKGRSSLNDIELELLGDVREKSILHLQCHFGQDSLSLARLGAKVTGADLSDHAIAKAIELSNKIDIPAEFVCCDIYDLPKYLQGEFDIVFTSYGTIGWLPDLAKWSSTIFHFLKPEGQFIMADFHPFIWMLDDDFTHIK